ncbi:hypothetical protein [Acinetobacter boissieri]|uniref:Uncharacterized protein n=1 Tax=Acinetobacter boissieri TaxID=1219383 RepID=A0A1G6IAA9_9GAMM|nr:hypothetical protein [Acinetobacter boissieri]SDC02945.1 hypothetical protein SAMN05421733_1085 [Acinetobacter boissieri]
MKQVNPKSQITTFKPSMGKAATALCSLIIATAFFYLLLVQADREQVNHELAVANARAQLAELNAQEQENNKEQHKGVN